VSTPLEGLERALDWLLSPISCARPSNIPRTPGAASFVPILPAACIWTPNSLSQEREAGLGAKAGPARLTSVFEKAGFKRFRVATHTPMNLIIEARP